jgi:hypothetical protein
MSSATEQVEQQLEQLTALCRTLAERLAVLESRVTQLEKRELEDADEYEEPEN